VIARRALLAASGALAAARPGRAAEETFPPAAEAAGRRLVRNGTGSRTYLGVEVYRAVLYLERRASDTGTILASPGVKLIQVRYLREVPVAGLALAWERSYDATCRCPVPIALRHWLRPIRPGDEERYLFLPDAAELTATDGPTARIAGAEASRTLLAIWIGPASPTAALRRGLLGER
jgi:Chalcone isomerase-like